MKTAQIIRRFHPGNWGGTENVVCRLTCSLIAAGHPTEILATAALGGSPEETVMNCPVRRFNYRYPYWPLSAGAKLALDKKGGNPQSTDMERYLDHHHFDIIHTHNLGRLGELALRSARRKSVPLVLTLHGGGLDVPEAEKTDLLTPLRHTIAYGGILERLTGRHADLMREADAVICVGANEFELLQSRCRGQRIVHLPNGVDCDYFTAPGAFDWRKELGLAPETKLLLNVSRIDPQKDQLSLLKLLKKLKSERQSAHLLLIGPVSSDACQNQLVLFARENGLEKNFTLIPGLAPGDEKLRSAFKSCDCFLLPSRHEPFGIVALEAWSAGAPLIASDAGGLGRLVEDGRTGIQFAAGNVDELLDAYRRVPARGGEICRNALAEARKYDWSKIAGRLLEVYDEVLHG